MKKKGFLLVISTFLMLNFLSADDLEQRKIREINNNFIISRDICLAETSSVLKQQRCLSDVEENYLGLVFEFCGRDDACYRKMADDLKLLLKANEKDSR